MKKSRLALIIVLASVLTAAAGGAGAWWGLRAHAQQGTEGAQAAASTATPAIDKRPQKYLNLEKVVVMLRRAPGDAAPHYLAMDLVIRTPEAQERVTRDHLPLLRSVAVKALSNYTADQAATMSIDEFATVLNTAYAERYAGEQRDKPFSEAMIGKLIVE